MKLGDFPRLLLELSTDVAVQFVRIVETPCRAEMTCGRDLGKARPVYTSALRAAWLSLAANAIDGGDKPRRLCDAEGTHAYNNNIPCSMSKRLG